MHKIGIISDTHGTLRNDVEDILRSCDAILHGGDIDQRSILARLEAIAPTIAVQGNNDRNWIGPLPVMRDFTLYGLNFRMIHDKKQLPAQMGDRNVIIYGHSHRYEETQKDGRLWLNPGSCGARRFRLPLTMAVMYVDSQCNFQVERIELSSMDSLSQAADALTPTCQEAAALDPISRALTPGAAAQLSHGDLLPLVQSVMRATDKGLPIGQIADKCGLSPELAQHICRLYLTHPGIDAEGILGKL